VDVWVVVGLVQCGGALGGCGGVGWLGWGGGSDNGGLGSRICQGKEG